MKHLALGFVLVVMATLFSLGTVQAVAAYNDSVSGSQTASTVVDAIAINLSATGDLPGMTKITLQRNTLNVTGGSWTFTVLPQNADALSSARGELTGTVTAGTLTLNADGTLASASAVQLTIQSGTGDFAGVTAGTGTVNVSSSSENASQLVGTLVLGF
jgi:hypothetical protein